MRHPTSSLLATGRLPGLRPTLCAAALAVLFASTPGRAAPTGAAVVNGQVSMLQQGNVLTVTNSNGAIINWQSFSIGANETTRFVQPSAASSVLNRVVGTDLSQILGRLESNGRVFLVNPAGILVGRDAVINVGSFVGSALQLRNEDFLANRLNFLPTPGAGSVRNEGSITSAQGGQVYLVASRVDNNGAITAPGGDVVLAAARTVQIGDTASPGVKIEVAGGETAGNFGRVVADAGSIGLFGALVKNSGSLNASSAVAEGGRILLKAATDTIVDGAASITTTGTRGGRIELLGNRVGVADRAVVDASGVDSGGTVLVGGDFQGANPLVQNAQATWVGPQTAIRADATGTGNGGKVVIWADDATRAYGTVSARGGAGGGNGGNIETSGRRYLDVEGIRVDTSAARGTAGTWLLDPEEITIVNNGSPGTDVSVTTAPNFAVSATLPAPTLSSATLGAAINANSFVNVSTGSAGSGTGDITFDASVLPILIAKTGNTFGSTLNINAFRNIIFSGGATVFQLTAGSGGASLTVNLNAGTGNAGPANVFTAANASVTLAGVASAPLTAVVGNGKTWFNSGTMNLSVSGVLKLNDGTSNATFNNDGTFNVVDNAVNWFITSTPTFQAGVFNNGGVVNIGTGGGSIEAVFNNLATGTLNVVAPAQTLVGVSVQNGQAMGGAINLLEADSTAHATLVMSEFHGTSASFTGTTIGGTGTLQVSGQSAVFNGVKAPGITLNASGGSTVVSGGASVFGALTRTGTMIITNGAFGLSGDFTVPAGITYGGSVGLGAGGNLTIGSAFTTSGALDLAAGGDVVINNATVQSSGSLAVRAGRDLVVNANAGSAGLNAAGAVNLTLKSPASNVALNGSASGSASIRSAAGPINVDFLQRPLDGISVDGVNGFTSGAFGSGMVVAGAPAILGTNLFIKHPSSANITQIISQISGAAGTGSGSTPAGATIVKDTATKLIDPNGVRNVDTPVAAIVQNVRNEKEKDPRDIGLKDFGAEPGQAVRKPRPGVCKAG